MEQQTKKELIKEFKEILNKLIEQKKFYIVLKDYPFKRKLKDYDKNLLKEGIKLYSEKLKNVTHNKGVILWNNKQKKN